MRSATASSDVCSEGLGLGPSESALVRKDPLCPATWYKRKNFKFVPFGSVDGAQLYQLELYAAASPMEFLTRKRLDGECSYTWRTVLSGSYVGCEQWLERGLLSAAGGSKHWLPVVLKGNESCPAAFSDGTKQHNTSLYFSAVRS